MARKLRNESTLAEVLLWCELRNKQILGFQFHRQVPMLNYIVDFYCHELQLAIEIDGESHLIELIATNDANRQKCLEAEGVKFLRFDDIDVKRNIGIVIDDLINWIEQQN